MLPSAEGMKEIVLEALDEYQVKGNPAPDSRDPRWLEFLAAYILNALNDFVQERRPK